MFKVLEGYQTLFPKGDLKSLSTLPGEDFKRIQNRRTFRIEREGRGFFIKYHRGVGWKEIFKNLLSLKLPVLGAGNEWRAIHKLQQLKVETMTPVAYGSEGSNPAGIHSVLITEALERCISLEHFCADWPTTPPPTTLKWTLIKRLAEMSSTLHSNGVNHRDMYICHFLLQQPWDGSEQNLHLHIIDLHRVQIRNKTPERWVVKDVGSLYFSAMEIGLTRRDLFRFIKCYSGRPLRQTLQEDARFWQKVQQRADALYRTRPGQ
ncbi:MAG: lipopolysaccharide core heptose(I) kinase RfaP [Candidatus Polarisedimenticolaceae bacterium]|nr:lipopolysaccharide core heptose(I) kinase RfaP [Candidatus Polarisedimenticolaceae bacterium]